MIHLQVPSSWSTRSRNLTCISMHQRRKRRTSSLRPLAASSFAKSSLEHMHCSTCNLEFSIDLGVPKLSPRKSKIALQIIRACGWTAHNLRVLLFKKIKCSDFIRCPSGQPLLVRFPYLESHLPPESWGHFLSRTPGNQLALPGPGFCHKPKKFTSDHSSVNLRQTHTLCYPTCMEA